MFSSAASHQTTRVSAAILAFVVLVPLCSCSSAKLPSVTGAMPEAGQTAPSFTLTSNEDKPTSLDDFKGRYVVLYFYPKDFTGGCTLEARNFQRDIARYESMNAVVIGVSVDSVQSHREFCAKEGLSFRLLSDPDGAVSTLYGSLNAPRRTSARNSFVIDPDGRIAKVFTSVSPATHSAEVLATLEELGNR